MSRAMNRLDTVRETHRYTNVFREVYCKDSPDYRPDASPVFYHRYDALTYKDADGRGMIVQVSDAQFDYLIDGRVVTQRMGCDVAVLHMVKDAYDRALKELGYESDELINHYKHYDVVRLARKKILLAINEYRRAS